MSLDQFFHILNPSKKNQMAVRHFFDERPGLQAHWVDREVHPTHLETMLEWAVIEGKTHLAVWGGDGTLNRTLQWLYNKDECLRDIKLCLIPAGTCNDFARHLKPGPWTEWIKDIEANLFTFRQFDLGLLNYSDHERIFLNNAGFGRTREALASKTSNPLRDISSFKTHQLQIEWGNEKVHQFETTKAYFGMVFNAPYFSGGMFFSKLMRADDGYLNGIFIPPQNKISLTLKFAKTKLGHSLMRKNDMMFRAKFCSVDSDQRMFLQADGETVSLDGVKNFKISLIEKAFTLLSPIEKELNQ